MQEVLWLSFALAMFFTSAVCLSETVSQFKRMRVLKSELGYTPAVVFVVVIFGFGSLLFFGVGVWALFSAFV